MNNFRQEIDNIDLQILDLLHLRGSIIDQVKIFKRSTIQNDDFRLFIKPDREHLLLKGIYEKAKSGGYSAITCARLWRQIIAFSNFIEQDLVLACLSEENIKNVYAHYTPYINVDTYDSTQDAINALVQNKCNILAFSSTDSNFYAALLNIKPVDVLIFASSQVDITKHRTFFCGKISIDEQNTEDRIYINFGTPPSDEEILCNIAEASIFTSKIANSNSLGFIHKDII